MQTTPKLSTAVQVATDITPQVFETVHLFHGFIFNSHVYLLWFSSNNIYIYIYGGRRVIVISGSLIWSKTLMELIFNSCGENQWSPEGPVSQIHSSSPPRCWLTLVAECVWTPGIFSELLRSVRMLKREWSAESNGKLLHLFNPR